jgi:hypothetical protein
MLVTTVVCFIGQPFVYLSRTALVKSGHPDEEADRSCTAPRNADIVRGHVVFMSQIPSIIVKLDHGVFKVIRFPGQGKVRLFVKGKHHVFSRPDSHAFFITW